MDRKIGDTLADVAAAAADAEAFCTAAGADEGQALRVGLALDELAANALIHGAERETAPDIHVELTSDAVFVTLRVSARGPRFDPTGHRPQNDEERSIGGRGIALVLAFADKLAYERDEDRNVTVFSVRKHAATEA